MNSQVLYRDRMTIFESTVTDAFAVHLPFFDDGVHRFGSTDRCLRESIESKRPTVRTDLREFLNLKVLRQPAKFHVFDFVLPTA